MMTVELYWWYVPIVLVIIGLVVAYIYHAKNYEPGGYFDDWVTGLIAFAIVVVFIVAAIAFAVGKLL